MPCMPLRTGTALTGTKCTTLVAIAMYACVGTAALSLSQGRGRARARLPTASRMRPATSSAVYIFPNGPRGVLDKLRRVLQQPYVVS